MERHAPKGIILILISGILNCLLGIVHQVVLYFSYKEYEALITPEADKVLADFLLFSIALGITLFFIGLLMIYCYSGMKRGEKWSYVVCIGASVLLLAFTITIGCVIGFDQPVAYVHLVNSILIAIPLILSRKAFA